MKLRRLVKLTLRPLVAINLLLALAGWKFSLKRVFSRPSTMRLAPANLCNYGCLFCEIHKDDAIWPKRKKNILGIAQIKFFEKIMSRTYRLDFCGGSAEPLLAKEFGKIAIYLKKKYKQILGVTTNASTLNRALAQELVTSGFDHILVSYHAGTDEGYRWLMTGDVDKVDKNIQGLIEEKRLSNKGIPVIKFNFALQRKNADEYRAVIDKAKFLGIDAIQVSKYYGGFNKLQHMDVGFDKSPSEGNEILDDIYKYAASKDVCLEPETPDYWPEYPELSTWDPEDVDYSVSCKLPWTHVQFNPVLDEPDKIYMGVCNRINLFKIDYNAESDTTTQPALPSSIWNHPVLSELRSTVNKTTEINSMCKFCKNRRVEELRVIDAARYAQLRDSAVKDFFRNCSKHIGYESSKSVEVLTENPYDNNRHEAALSEFSDRLARGS